MESIILKIGTRQVNIEGSLNLYNPLLITFDPVFGWQIVNQEGDVLRQPKIGKWEEPTHRFKERGQAEKFARQIITKVEKLQKAQPKPDANESDRTKRPNGYLVPVVGDAVYSVTGALIGTTKWKAKVLKVNPDSGTMVIEKGWEKTKAGNPSKMTVPIYLWTVENDPQKQKDIDKNLAEKEEAKAKAEKLLKQSKDSVDNAIKAAVESGIERLVTRDELKKGDIFYLYRNMDMTGDHIKQKYEYTSDTFARMFLPDGSREWETHVLGDKSIITVDNNP